MVLGVRSTWSFGLLSHVSRRKKNKDMAGSEEPIARGYDRANVKAESAQYCTQLRRFIIERRICFIQKLLFRLDQITGKYGKTSMLGAINSISQSEGRITGSLTRPSFPLS